MTRIALLLVTVAVVLGTSTVACADSRWPRWYVSPRVGTAILPDTEPASGIEVSRTQQATGLSVGVDVGPHLALELAADAFETTLHAGRRVGEYGMLTLVPQARLRAPLGGRLTPYAVAGVGVLRGEFNDRKREGVGLAIRAEETTPVGALGVGVDYALSDDLALGLEARYLISGDHRIQVGERGGEANLDAFLVGVTLRAMMPGGEGRHTVPAPPPDHPRWYLGFRYGGAAALRGEAGAGVDLEPEHAALGDTFGQLFGVAAGVDLGRYLGVELAADGHERVVSVRDVGLVGEYAIYSVVPQLRARYPLLDGRLVPYGLLGVGASYTEFNDRKPRGEDTRVDNGSELAVVGAAGIGVEYFVTRHIAVGLEAKYHVTRGHTLRLASGSRDVDLDTVLIAAGVRVYLEPLLALFAR